MIIDFIEKTIQIKNRTRANVVFSKLNDRLIDISSRCLIGERQFKHGAFNFPQNQWKIIRALICDLPFAFNNLMQQFLATEWQIVSLLVDCNEILSEIDSNDPWTESRIQRFQQLTQRYFFFSFQLSNWNRLQQECTTLFGPIQEFSPSSMNLSRLKFHLIAAHVADVIRQFGTLKMGSTQFLERDHKTNSKLLYVLTNKHDDFTEQIARRQDMQRILSIDVSLLSFHQMSIQFVEKLCRPEQFLKKEQDEPGITKVLGKGNKSKIGEIMKLSHFGLPCFGESLFSYLLRNQQLPIRFQILEDLMAQDIFVHKTAAFEPCQKKGMTLVLQATHSYHKHPCFDAVSFLHNGQMHFGLVRMIFAFNKGWQTLGRRNLRSFNRRASTEFHVSSQRTHFTLWSSNRLLIYLQHTQILVQQLLNSIFFVHQLFHPSLSLKRKSPAMIN
jgi:hypothetical protein